WVMSEGERFRTPGEAGVPYQRAGYDQPVRVRPGEPLRAPTRNGASHTPACRPADRIQPTSPPSDSNRPAAPAGPPISARQPSSSCNTSTANVAPPEYQDPLYLFQLSSSPAGDGYRRAIWSDVYSRCGCSVRPDAVWTVDSLDVSPTRSSVAHTDHLSR